MHTVSRCVESFVPNYEMEIDILVENQNTVMAIEVKNNLKVSDVMYHIERLKNFKKAFPKKADCIVYGAVAGIYISEKADKFAYKNGIFVLGVSGSIIKILNDDKSQPTRW